jgi:DNA polymerase III epsilon subunit-like protein
MNSYLFFDIETTGLPLTIGFMKYHAPEQTHYYDSSRVIEVAYIITDEHFNTLCTSSVLINNSVNVTNTFIHGISNNMIKQDGVSMRHFLNTFKRNIQKYNVTKLISHNIHFDRNILLSEIYRFNTQQIQTRSCQYDDNFFKCLPYECTMFLGKYYLNIKKYPKLVNLHKELSNLDEPQHQTHRALDDTRMCLDCYKKMKN